MAEVKIRNTILGDGVLKICLPVVAKTENAILLQMRNVVANAPDVIELRGDWFDNIENPLCVKQLLERVREMAGDIPVLFTFRTANEGGEKSISYENYKALLLSVAATGLVDAVDVEAFINYGKKNGVRLQDAHEDEQHLKRLMEYEDADGVKSLIGQLQKEGMVVIASNHDFQKTPSKQQMIVRLSKMQQFGADVAKLAVMPRNSGDVLKLSDTTYHMTTQVAKTPVITMSMGSLGVSSRICSGIYGNAMTFATAGVASAPGQIEIGKLREMLLVLGSEQTV